MKVVAVASEDDSSRENIEVLIKWFETWHRVKDRSDL